MLTIGCESLINYPEVQNIVHKVGDARYIKCYNLVRIFGNVVIRRLCSWRSNRVLESLGIWLQFSWLGGICRGHCKIRHFFNTISYGFCPWVTTFETVVPRYRGALDGKNTFGVRWGLRQLSSKKCKALLAISSRAYKHQVAFLKRIGLECIVDKMQVIHPPQSLLVDEKFIERKKRNNSVIQFAFLGRSFFRKGGFDVVKVFDRLAKQGQKFHLTVISKLEVSDWCVPAELEREVRWIEKVMSESEWCTWYKETPNASVLEMLKTIDVGLLATHQDTYGYSVLEMQAAGVPVITTNVCALPEINNNACGWIVPVPINEFGDALLADNNINHFYQLSELIQTGLEKCIIDILENPEQIKAKARNAYNRIKEFHDPQMYGEKLRKIYQEATNVK